MKIKAAFETWVWKDVERADRLARIYNDRFNNLVPRHFDGSHLTIPGASSVINFYAHQKRAIWRIVASGTTYVAHAVGAGKDIRRRRDHGAEAAGSHHQGDDGGARSLPGPGEPRVPAALPDRPKSWSPTRPISSRTSANGFWPERRPRNGTASSSPIPRSSLSLPRPSLNAG